MSKLFVRCAARTISLLIAINLIAASDVPANFSRAAVINPPLTLQRQCFFNSEAFANVAEFARHLLLNEKPEAIIEAVQALYAKKEFQMLHELMHDLAKGASEGQKIFLVAAVPYWFSVIDELAIPAPQAGESATPLYSWLVNNRKMDFDVLLKPTIHTKEYFDLARLGMAQLSLGVAVRFYEDQKYVFTWDLSQKILEMLHKDDFPLRNTHGSMAHRLLSTLETGFTRMAAHDAVNLWDETADIFWIKTSAELFEKCAAAQDRLQSPEGYMNHALSAMCWIVAAEVDPEQASAYVERAKWNLIVSGPLKEDHNRLGAEGYVALYEGHFREAEKFFKESIALDPDKSYIADLSRAYFYSGNLGEAAKTAVDIQKPTIQNLYERGLIHFNLANNADRSRSSEYEEVDKDWSLLQRNKIHLLILERYGELESYYKNYLRVCLYRGNSSLAMTLVLSLFGRDSVETSDVLNIIKEELNAPKESDFLRKIFPQVKAARRQNLQAHIAELSSSLNAPAKTSDALVSSWNKLRKDSKARQAQMEQFFASALWNPGQSPEWRLAQMTEWARTWWDGAPPLAKVPQALPILLREIQKTLDQNAKDVLENKGMPLTPDALKKLQDVLQSLNTSGEAASNRIASLLKAIELEKWLPRYAAVLRELQSSASPSPEEIWIIRDDLIKLMRENRAARTAMRPLLENPLKPLAALNRQRQNADRSRREQTLRDEVAVRINSFETRLIVFEEDIDSWRDAQIKRHQWNLFKESMPVLLEGIPLWLSSKYPAQINSLQKRIRRLTEQLNQPPLKASSIPAKPKQEPQRIGPAPLAPQPAPGMTKPAEINEKPSTEVKKPQPIIAEPPAPAPPPEPIQIPQQPIKSDGPVTVMVQWSDAAYHFFEKKLREEEHILPESSRTWRNLLMKLGIFAKDIWILSPQGRIEDEQIDEDIVQNTAVTIQLRSETAIVQALVFFTPDVLKDFWPEENTRPAPGPWPVEAPANEATLLSILPQIGLTEDHLYYVNVVRNQKIFSPMDHYKTGDHLIIMFKPMHTSA